MFGRNDGVREEHRFLCFLHHLSSWDQAAWIPAGGPLVIHQDAPNYQFNHSRSPLKYSKWWWSVLRPVFPMAGSLCTWAPSSLRLNTLKCSQTVQISRLMLQRCFNPLLNLQKGSLHYQIKNKLMRFFRCQTRILFNSRKVTEHHS